MLSMNSQPSPPCPRFKIHTIDCAHLIAISSTCLKIITPQFITNTGCEKTSTNAMFCVQEKAIKPVNPKRVKIQIIFVLRPQLVFIGFYFNALIPILLFLSKREMRKNYIDYRQIKFLRFYCDVGWIFQRLRCKSRRAMRCLSFFELAARINSIKILNSQTSINLTRRRVEITFWLNFAGNVNSEDNCSASFAIIHRSMLGFGSAFGYSTRISLNCVTLFLIPTLFSTLLMIGHFLRTD